MSDTIDTRYPSLPNPRSPRAGDRGEQMDWNFCGLIRRCIECEEEAEDQAEIAVWEETVNQLEKLQE